MDVGRSSRTIAHSKLNLYQLRITWKSSLACLSTQQFAVVPIHVWKSTINSNWSVNPIGLIVFNVLLYVYFTCDFITIQMFVCWLLIRIVCISGQIHFTHSHEPIQASEIRVIEFQDFAHFKILTAHFCCFLCYFTTFDWHFGVASKCRSVACIRS